MLLIKDKHYLQLQFKSKIYSIYGFEFQNFFEKILEKSYKDFQKIKPNGRDGDGGNDGYIKSEGFYFQVYSPHEPIIKEKEAIKKLNKDFKTLMDSGWNYISEIKTYYFVYNDKYSGSIQQIEEAINQMSENHPNIKFKLFLAKDLEKLFFELNEEYILALGFNIDSRETLKVANQILDNLKKEVDSENVFAYEIIRNYSDSIKSLGNDKLTYKFEMLLIKGLLILDKRDEAKLKYTMLIMTNPDQINAYLRLAELFYSEHKIDEFDIYYNKAIEIDSQNWHVKLFELILKKGELTIKELEKEIYCDNNYLKSNVYGVKANLCIELDAHKAIKYINKAIQLNPSRFQHHYTKLNILVCIISTTNNLNEKLSKLKELKSDLEIIKVKFSMKEKLGKISKIYLEYINYFIAIMENDSATAVKTGKQIISEITSCNLTVSLENLLVLTLQNLLLPLEQLNKITAYLKQSNIFIINDLLRFILFQFIQNEEFGEAKSFFENYPESKEYKLINYINTEQYDLAINILSNDISLAKSFAFHSKSHLDLNILIINILSDDDPEKNKLQLLYEIQTDNLNKVLELLPKVDLSTFGFSGSKIIFKFLVNNNLWEFLILFLPILISIENDNAEKLMLEVELHNTYLNLKKYKEAIQLGIDILKENHELKLLTPYALEMILSNTIFSLQKRSNQDKRNHTIALELIKRFKLPSPSFRFKVEFEADIYLKNNLIKEAVQSVVEGVKSKKTLSEIEYSNLYYFFAIKLGNRDFLNLNSKPLVKEGNFIKLEDKTRWYYLGEGNELDSIKISKESSKFNSLISKKKGEKILLKQPYSGTVNETKIELIYSIEQYILWKVVENFNTLAQSGDIEGVEMLKIPEKNGELDIDVFFEFMENMNNNDSEFLKLYRINKIPFSMLASYEKGFNRALWRIVEQKNGFINFMYSNENFASQVEVAREIISGDKTFYLDGTSAYFLTESGMLKKISKYINNLKIPQSVINFLIEIQNDIYLTSYRCNALGFSDNEDDYSNIISLLKNNFKNCIEFLEKNNQIEDISEINKTNCFSEKNIFDEFVDAYVLSQLNKKILVTDDVIYSYMNQEQTKKTIPKSCSSFALVKVLFEDNKITLDDYLDYFNYVTNYRFRFISISTDEIINIILGNKDIFLLMPSNLRKLNLNLIFSEEYGVKFENMLSIVTQVLINFLIDDSIPSYNTGKIFIEFIENCPVSLSKREFAEKCFNTCILTLDASEINKKQSVSILIQKLEYFQELIEQF